MAAVTGPSNVPPDAQRWRAPGGRWHWAVQVTHRNRLAVAAWCDGRPWGMGVIVPTPLGGEDHAEVGAFVIQSDQGWWVWPRQEFLRQWLPEAAD